MIRINLLPEEYRRSERTSPKLFAAVLGSVMCVCCAFGWFGFVYFGELGRLEVAFAAANEQLETLKPQEARFESLTKERSDYQARAKTIEQISRGRIVWSRLLDNVVDLVNGDGDIDGPRAWLREMRVTRGRASQRATVGPQIQMPGAVQGAEIRRLSDFFDQIKATPFFEHVVNEPFPEGEVVPDPTRSPEESVVFGLNLQLEPAEQWHTPTATVEVQPAKK